MNHELRYPTPTPAGPIRIMLSRCVPAIGYRPHSARARSPHTQLVIALLWRVFGAAH